MIKYLDRYQHGCISNIQYLVKKQDDTVPFVFWGGILNFQILYFSGIPKQPETDST